jgi:nucleoside-diphosphate-sugar epimerase
MKILIIGGTGTISSAITRQLSETGHDLWLLNRGTRKNEVPAHVRQVICDIDDEATVLAHPELQIEEPDFDAWCDRVIEAQEEAKHKF